jgi:hypothetical protein
MPLYLLFWISYGVLLGAPMILLGAFLWCSVRKTDAAHVGRGFDLKQTMGQPPVATRKENDHG